MCEIKQDEVERLVALRRNFRESFEQAEKSRKGYASYSAADREGCGRADAWNMAAILVEEMIVKALGYDPTARPSSSGDGS